MQDNHDSFNFSSFNVNSSSGVDLSLLEPLNIIDTSPEEALDKSSVGNLMETLKENSTRSYLWQPQ